MSIGKTYKSHFVVRWSLPTLFEVVETFWHLSAPARGMDESRRIVQKPKCKQRGDTQLNKVPSPTQACAVRQLDLHKISTLHTCDYSCISPLSSGITINSDA